MTREEIREEVEKELCEEANTMRGMIGSWSWAVDERLARREAEAENTRLRQEKIDDFNNYAQERLNAAKLIGEQESELARLREMVEELAMIGLQTDAYERYSDFHKAVDDGLAMVGPIPLKTFRSGKRNQKT